jgi:hypothetical protein
VSSVSFPIQQEDANQSSHGAGGLGEAMDEVGEPDAISSDLLSDDVSHE